MTTSQLESVVRLDATGRRQRGVTLVEILVTVVIISVGLLGVAALHTLSLKHGQDAHVRSQATAMATDIIDRMRANPENARNDRYNIAMGDPAPTSPTTLADADRAAWKNALAAMLPNGNGSIARVNGTVPQQFRITVQWGERNDTLTFTTNAVL